MIWISHSEIIFQVAFSLDATQLFIIGFALSADRLAAAAAVSAQHFACNERLKSMIRPQIYTASGHR